MSDTPRTDAAEHEDSYWCARLADFARILERELAAVTEQRDKAWLLAEHREKNVELEGKLIVGLAKALKALKLARGWIHPDRKVEGRCIDKTIAELEEAK